MARSWGSLVILFLVLGCAAPKPILYPNAHLKEVGEDVADRDIDECREMAKDAGATASQGKGGQVAGSTAAGGAIGSASGAVGGAVVGHPGRGAMVGAAAGATGGFLRGLFRRSPPSNRVRSVRVPRLSAVPGLRWPRTVGRKSPLIQRCSSSRSDTESISSVSVTL